LVTGLIMGRLRNSGFSQMKSARPLHAYMITTPLHVGSSALRRDRTGTTGTATGTATPTGTGAAPARATQPHIAGVNPLPLSPSAVRTAAIPCAGASMLANRCDRWDDVTCFVQEGLQALSSRTSHTPSYCLVLPFSQ
jgi:hypothetical protein